MSDYDSRAQQYGFASKEEISKIVTQNPHAVLLDVRTSDEIAETGPFKIGDQPWVTSSCTPDSCPELEAKADQLLPDKSAPIIVYCKSGRRASKAEEVLKKQGYERVLNAGGFEDLDYLRKTFSDGAPITL